MTLFEKYRVSNNGSVTIETSLIITVMIFLTIGVLEAGLAFWQWNGAQKAARHGARLAATSDPIANHILSMTGLENGVSAGDPFPNYAIKCSGQTSSCDQGSFNHLALQELIYGPDGDGVCGNTTFERSGVCDVVSYIKPNNIDVSYTASGLGRAGSPGKPRPLISVTVKELNFDFVFLDVLVPGKFKKIPPVSVSVMSEDLRNDA